MRRFALVPALAVVAGCAGARPQRDDGSWLPRWKAGDAWTVRTYKHGQESVVPGGRPAGWMPDARFRFLVRDADHPGTRWVVAVTRVIEPLAPHEPEGGELVAELGYDGDMNLRTITVGGRCAPVDGRKPRPESREVGLPLEWPGPHGPVGPGEDGRSVRVRLPLRAEDGVSEPAIDFVFEPGLPFWREVETPHVRAELLR